MYLNKYNYKRFWQSSIHILLFYNPNNNSPVQRPLLAANLKPVLFFINSHSITMIIKSNFYCKPKSRFLKMSPAVPSLPLFPSGRCRQFSSPSSEPNVSVAIARVDPFQTYLLDMVVKIEVNSWTDPAVTKIWTADLLNGRQRPCHSHIRIRSGLACIKLKKDLALNLKVSDLAIKIVLPEILKQCTSQPYKH